MPIPFSLEGRYAEQEKPAYQDPQCRILATTARSSKHLREYQRSVSEETFFPYFGLEETPVRQLLIAESANIQVIWEKILEIKLPPNEEIQEQMVQAISGFQAYALSINLVSQPMLDSVEMLLGKNPNVQVSAANFGDFHYQKDTFPTQTSEYPPINGSTKVIKSFMHLYATLFPDVPLDLIVSAAIAQHAIHEWAHALEQAVSIQIHENGVPTFENNWLEDTIFQAAKGVSLPTLYGASPKMLREIHGERFATGFELLGLEWSLMHPMDMQKASLTKEEAGLFIPSYLQLSKSTIRDYKAVREELHRYGFNDIDILDFVRQIRIEANTLEIESTITNFIMPDLWFTLGYSDPYTFTQLQSMLQQLDTNAREERK